MHESVGFGVEYGQGSGGQCRVSQVMIGHTSVHLD